MYAYSTIDLNLSRWFMLVVMQAHATEAQVRAVCQKIEALGYRAHSIPGAERTAIGITGNKGEVEPGTLEEMSGVQEVIRVTKPYKLVSRDFREENTIIRFAGSDATIGGPGLARLRAGSRRLLWRSASSVRGRSSFAVGLTSRAHLRILFRAWVKKVYRSWLRCVRILACGQLPRPSITNRSTWSSSTPTSFKLAPAICRTTLCSGGLAARSGR